MKSLEVLEELNKILIDANKRCELVYQEVGEQEKILRDYDHELLSSFDNLSAKQKREYTDNYFETLAERHNLKYEYRELEILKELFNLPQNKKLETAMNEAIAKLRKLSQEQEQPIYFKRAKKNKGQVIVVGDDEEGNK